MLPDRYQSLGNHGCPFRKISADVIFGVGDMNRQRKEKGGRGNLKVKDRGKIKA
jgi:hypothetical protein